MAITLRTIKRAPNLDDRDENRPNRKMRVWVSIGNIDQANTVYKAKEQLEKRYQGSLSWACFVHNMAEQLLKETKE